MHDLPSPLLLDFSCIDNLKMEVLENSYYRTCLNYVEITAYIYTTARHKHDSNSKITAILKRTHHDGKKEKINAFCHLLKFSNAVPELARLLRAGGIWSLNCETAYLTLVRSKVGQVSFLLFIHVCCRILKPISTGYQIHSFRMCQPI